MWTVSTFKLPVNLQNSDLTRSRLQTANFTYVNCFSNFQRFSLPAVNKQISHSFVVDLHVRHSEKELLIWKLEIENHSKKEQLFRNVYSMYECNELQYRYVSNKLNDPYRFNSFKDIFHSHRNDSGVMVNAHHSEGLSR